MMMRLTRKPSSRDDDKDGDQFAARGEFEVALAQASLPAEAESDR
ncbi:MULTISPECIES: hypothetical protein [Bradyrhizobium]|nr:MULTISPECIES: hypothetical protein [Bradyrhizobium]